MRERTIGAAGPVWSYNIVMFILFLIGLFCFLLVLGFMLGKEPLAFALVSLVVLVAICFVGFIGLIAWAIFSSH